MWRFDPFEYDKSDECIEYDIATNIPINRHKSIGFLCFA